MISQTLMTCALILVAYGSRRARAGTAANAIGSACVFLSLVSVLLMGASVK